MRIFHENQVPWPAGREVTTDRKSGPFQTNMANACDRIESELSAFTKSGQQWRVTEVWIFADANIGAKGRFLVNSPGYRDPRVAVKFELDGAEYQIAADRYHEPWQNLAGIAEYIKAIRAQERNGVFTAKEMMAAFAALPGPRRWFDGCEDPDRRYLELAKQHHPDAGGEPAIMAEINAEYQSLKERSK